MTSPQIPPDTAAAGQTGHIAAHNAMSDVLTEHDAQLQAIPALHWGTAALSSGSVTVSLSQLTDASVVLVSRVTPSGTLGYLSVPVVTPGSGFTVTSSSAGDNSLIGYLVLG